MLRCESVTHRCIELDIYLSNLLQSPPCSIIQGAKLSSTLYTLYTHEIPLIHKLITHDIYRTINKQQNIDCIKNTVKQSTSLMTLPT